MKNGILMIGMTSLLWGCSQSSSLSAMDAAADAYTPDSRSTIAPRVAGGSVPRPVPTPTVARKDPKTLWQQRNAQFARMTSWRLQGKVGLRVRQQSGSFNISWLQQGNGNYEMNIKNPLTGSVMAYLNGIGDKVTLRAADGKTYQDTNAERLLQQHAGMGLPLNGMRYWARGVATPSDVVEGLQLDNLGRPQMLQQSGWVIKYTTYRDNSPTALPTRMEISRAVEQVNVKVIAKDWQTRF